MSKADLGEKLTCSGCEARYYDLNKTPALCPKCGAENARPKVFKTKKAAAAAAAAAKAAEDVPAPKKVADDGDGIEDVEDDDEDDDILSDDDDLDDDDDVVSVIGPIDSDKETDI